MAPPIKKLSNSKILYLGVMKMLSVQNPNFDITDEAICIGHVWVSGQQ